MIPRGHFDATCPYSHRRNIVRARLKSENFEPFRHETVSRVSRQHSTQQGRHSATAAEFPVSQAKAWLWAVANGHPRGEPHEPIAADSLTTKPTSTLPTRAVPRQITPSGSR